MPHTERGPTAISSCGHMGWDGQGTETMKTGKPRGPRREPSKDFDPVAKCLGCSLCGLHGTCDTPVRQLASPLPPSHADLHLPAYVWSAFPLLRPLSASSSSRPQVPPEGGPELLNWAGASARVCKPCLAHRRGLTSPPSLHPAPFPKPHSTPQSPHWNTQTEAQRPGGHAPTFPASLWPQVSPAPGEDLDKENRH